MWFVRACRGALRRSLLYPGRLIVAIAACSCAWFGYIEIVNQRVTLNSQALARTLLGSQPGFRLEMAPQHWRTTSVEQNSLPIDLLSYVMANSGVVVLQLRNEEAILDGGRNVSLSVSVIVVDDHLWVPDRRGNNRWPLCSLIGNPDGFAGSDVVVFRASNWRCSQIPIPSGLEFLGFQRAQYAIAIPRSAVTHLIGRVDGKEVEVLWFSTSNVQAIQKIKDWPNQRGGGGVQLRGISEEIVSQQLSLGNVSQQFALFSLALSFVSVVLYARSLWDSLAEEIFLRSVVGLRPNDVAKWLTVELTTQLLGMCLIPILICALVEFKLMAALFDKILLAMSCCALFSLIVAPLASYSITYYFGRVGRIARA